MKSKQKLMELLGNLEKERCANFTKMFECIPNEVIAQMSYKKMQKNDTIIWAGDSCDAVYIVLKGRVTGLDYQCSGNIYAFMDNCKMDVVGDFEVFGGMDKYSVTVRTEEECEILRLPSHIYLKWMKADVNALFFRTTKLMNRLLQEKEGERKSLFLNCKDRVIMYLVHSYEESVDKKERYRVKKTQTQLADNIGFHTRSVQRSVLSLKKEGLICVESGKIYISKEQYLGLKECVKC